MKIISSIIPPVNEIDPDIFSFSKDAVFINIACYPAGVKFDDGRNVHVSLFSPIWWHGYISAISENYNLKIFLVCSYFKNNKLDHLFFGINDIVLLTGYQSHVIEDYIQTKYPNINIIFSTQRNKFWALYYSDIAQKSTFSENVNTLHVFVF